MTTATHTTQCQNWVHQVTDRVVAGHFALVVMANRISVTAVGHDMAGSVPVYQTGYEKVLTRLKAAHLTVVGVHDTPNPDNIDIPSCLAAHPTNYAACSGARSAWAVNDPITTAAAAMNDSDITTADLTDDICYPAVCSGAVGKVVVYFDASHLTATFAKTLAPYLSPYLTGAIKG